MRVQLSYLIICHDFEGSVIKKSFEFEVILLFFNKQKVRNHFHLFIIFLNCFILDRFINHNIVLLSLFFHKFLWQLLSLALIFIFHNFIKVLSELTILKPLCLLALLQLVHDFVSCIAKKIPVIFLLMIEAMPYFPM